MEYTHEYSQYPDELIELVDYKNVDDTVGGLINEIETYRAQGNYLAATDLIERYADRLKKYNIDMTLINSMVEEIRNAQIKALTDGQFLSIDEEEPERLQINEGFVWVGGE